MKTNKANNENEKKVIDMLKIILFVPMFIVNCFFYVCEGVYFIFYFLVVKPKEFLVDLYYNLFTSKKVKKQKEIVAVDIFEEQNKNSSSDKSSTGKTSAPENKKDLFHKMRENRAKVDAKKKATKLSKRQKDKLDIERQEFIKSMNESSEKRLEKPEIFRYKAMDKDGRIVKDIFFGVSKIDIYTFLTNEGYTVYSIELSKFDNFLQKNKLTNFGKLSNKSLVFFLTQLSTYIRSGITLTEAMRILTKQLSKNKSEARIMQTILYYLIMGESFSNALSRLPGVFPNLVINMLKAAEATGDLGAVLDDLTDYYNEINKTRKDMISAMTYPVILIVFATAITVFMLLKIVPQFSGIYSSAGAEMNKLTLFVLAASDFLKKYAITLLLIFALIIFLIIMAYKNVYIARRLIQTMLMKMPVIGGIIISNEITIFTKTFASLLKNDVFITDTIDILSKLTNNEIYKEIMLDTITNIAKGDKISKAFKDHWAVPDIAYYMIVTGENTGELPNMMEKVSVFYQEQHRTTIATLKSLIEPIMIFFLAIVVGGIMVAILMPMFGLYGKIG